MSQDKSKKPSQHVIVSPDGWSVRHSGASRSSKTFEKKDSAVDFARKTAKANSSSLFIHDRDGRILRSETYGNDLFAPKPTGGMKIGRSSASGMFTSKSSNTKNAPKSKKK